MSIQPNKSFKTGEVVVLKSGSDPMTVIGPGTALNETRCVWFPIGGQTALGEPIYGECKTGNFATEVLQSLPTKSTTRKTT